MKKFFVVFMLFMGMTCLVLVPTFAAEQPSQQAPAGAPAAPADKEVKAPPPPKYDMEGAPLPPTTLKNLKGDSPVTLDKIGKPALIIFMNSTCSACRAEITSLSKMVDKLEGKLGAYLVTVDFDSDKTISRFPSLARMTWGVLDGSDFEAAKLLGFNFTPATVITDAAGKQIFRKAGYNTGEENEIAAAVMKVMKK